MRASNICDIEVLTATIGQHNGLDYVHICTAYPEVPLAGLQPEPRLWLNLKERLIYEEALCSAEASNIDVSCNRACKARRNAVS